MASSEDDRRAVLGRASNADEESPLVGNAPQRALTSIAGVITVLLLGANANLRMQCIFHVAHSNPNRRVHIQRRFYNHYGGSGLYLIRVQSIT